MILKKYQLHIIFFFLLSVVLACGSDPRQNTRIPTVPNLNDPRRILMGIEFLTDVIRKNTNSSQSYFKRAELYTQQHKWREALNDINSALEISPNNATYLLERASVLYKTRQFDKALSDARRSEVLGQDTPQLYTLLGALSQEKRNFRDAKLYLAKALQMAPYEGEAYFYNGMLATKESDTASAIALIQRSLELKPRFLDSYVALSGIYTKLRAFDEALAYNNLGIKYFPTDSKLFYERGTLYHIQRRTDSALICYRKAAMLDTSNYMANFQIGAIALKWHNYSLAAQNFAKVARQNPKFPKINFLLGTTFEKLGNLAKAVEQYTLATNIDPTDWRARGRLFISQKRKAFFDTYGYYPIEKIDSTAILPTETPTDERTLDTGRIKISILQPHLELNTKRADTVREFKVNKPIFEPAIRPKKRGL